MRFKKFSAAVLAAFVVFTSSALAETILGRVVGVTDGDTIKLLTPEKQQIKVRLYGIDAPESKQAFGARSKQSLSDIAFGKEVKLVTVNTDRYGRTVAWLYVGDINANEAQVRAGMAWWYQAYAKHETRLRTLQEEAQRAKRGLWADKDPVPPWTWRQERRSAK
jgi:endonuclease YncB( thermonuclease family)